MVFACGVMQAPVSAHAVDDAVEAVLDPRIIEPRWAPARALAPPPPNARPSPVPGMLLPPVGRNGPRSSEWLVALHVPAGTALPPALRWMPPGGVVPDRPER